MSAVRTSWHKAVARLVCTALAVIPLGCDSDSSKAPSNQAATGNNRAYWLRYLERSIAAGVYHGAKAERASLLLKDLRNGNGPITPRLLSAELAGQTSRPCLTLDFYDETGSIAAVRIQEERSDGRPVLIEDYEVCPGGRGDAAFLDSMILPCQIRKAGQRKEPQAWAEYAARNVRDRSLLPAIYTAEPSDSIRVFISLIDVSGAESNRVLLSTGAEKGSEAIFN